MHDLNGAMSLKRTIFATYRELTKSMDAYRDKFLKDPRNPDNLHDFRVTVRKLRVGLKYFIVFFSQEKTKEQAFFFQNIQKNTNLLRDLDVFEYNDINILNKIHPGFEFNVIERLIKEKHQKEIKKTVAFLSSNDYIINMNSWKCYQQNETYNNNTLFRTSKSFTNYTINSIWLNVMKTRLTINNHFIDEKPIHKLRILIKNTRYLLSFFSPIYNPTKSREVLSYLKRAQDIFGSPRDISVRNRTLIREISGPHIMNRINQYYNDMKRSLWNNVRAQLDSLDSKKTRDLISSLLED